MKKFLKIVLKSLACLFCISGIGLSCYLSVKYYDVQRYVIITEHIFEVFVILLLIIIGIMCAIIQSKINTK